ncbi:hypothetical protein BTJ40_14785 [Microbulbifer sp. A4B17]|uniref:hypothetical protein n=1 Tax=Microbulbifer sp. A4B17 TaxID=359370 RepID=UPI000D52E819|nr:hypothetical protein [Microbulbifer sp. A4B17]AWF81989.1 hypothetical protein BTJ40_14785 [Microbulbifer sp. A4B17]
MKKITLVKSVFIVALLSISQVKADQRYKNSGYDQLVDAFDAAWVRVVESGKYREIILGFDEPVSGVVDAKEYIVNQADCLPNPEVTPFPAKPRGRFAQILKSGQIRRGYVGGAPWYISSGRNTSDWFNSGMGGSNILGNLLEAILLEISVHYNVEPIEIFSIEIPFPFNTTSALQDGIFGTNLNPFSESYELFEFVSMPGVTVDFIDQINAKGGESEGLRRLKGRRETCTVISSGQYIHLPIGSPFTVRSIDDLIENPEIKICTGNLSTQTVNRYFSGNVVLTKREFDIKECYEAIRDGEADVFFNSLPVNPSPESLSIDGGLKYQPSIDTKIVAGTPYWFKEDGVFCEPVLVPGPFNFGTYRECKKK